MRKQVWPICLLMLLSGTVVLGDNPPAKPQAGGASHKPAKSKKRQEKLPAFTPEREAAALTFVRLHHSELTDLLAHLKSSNPADYETAIRELFRASEQLTQTKERDHERYTIELEAWKLKSRIQLLAARASMSKDEGLEKELREALEKRLDLRLQQLLLDRKRAAERLQKLDATIEELQRERRQQADKQFEALLREIDRSRSAARARRNNKTALRVGD